MRNADRQRAAADRTPPAMGKSLARGKLHAAFAVTVEMVLALLGEKLDGADITVARLQGLANGEVVHRAIEGSRLAAEFSGRMGIRVGDQSVAVEHRQSPIHRRIGGKPGLDGEDVIGEVAVTLRN
jgi:hypothetical protein